MLVLLGDRFEIFAAAQAALIAKIPIAHIGGGDTTLVGQTKFWRKMHASYNNLQLQINITLNFFHQPIEQSVFGEA